MSPQVLFDNDSAEGRIAVDIDSRLIAVLIDDGMNFVARNVDIVAVGAHPVMRRIAEEVLGNRASASSKEHGGSVDAIDSSKVAHVAVVNKMPTLSQRVAVSAGNAHAARAEGSQAGFDDAAELPVENHDPVSSHLFDRRIGEVATFAILHHERGLSASLESQVR